MLPEMPQEAEAKKSVLLKALQAFVVNVANISTPFFGITGQRHPASVTGGVVLECGAWSAPGPIHSNLDGIRPFS
jgi:hypothetical protein